MYSNTGGVPSQKCTRDDWMPTLIADVTIPEPFNTRCHKESDNNHSAENCNMDNTMFTIHDHISSHSSTFVFHPFIVYSQLYGVV